MFPPPAVYGWQTPTHHGRKDHPHPNGQGVLDQHAVVHIIVDKYGRTIFETSIPEGEPADLLQKDYLKFYKTLGRDKFVKILEDNPRLPDPKVKALMKEAVDAIMRTKSKVQPPEEPDIFKDAY